MAVAIGIMIYIAGMFIMLLFTDSARSLSYNPDEDEKISIKTKPPEDE